jgi:acyl-CoA reductase-like NAD-dependent aldehyde dehydrogenase
MNSMPMIVESDPQQMQSVFAAQQATAIRWRESLAEQRLARLKRLREAVLAHRQAFYQAFEQDYRKPSAEVDVTELMPILDEIRHAIGRLKQWMKPQKVSPTSLMLTDKRMDRISTAWPSVNYCTVELSLKLVFWPFSVGIGGRQYGHHQTLRNDAAMFQQ